MKRKISRRVVFAAAGILAAALVGFCLMQGGIDWGGVSQGSIDKMEENAVRLCVGEVCEMEPYDDRNIFTADQYAPVMVDVFETKTVEIHRVKRRRNYLRQGWDSEAVIDRIERDTNLTTEAARSYVAEAVPFTEGVLSGGITIEECEVRARCVRTAGYRVKGSAPLVMCPEVEEEQVVTYTVWISFRENDRETTNFADITHMVGGGEERYLHSTEDFSTASIADHVYEYYTKNS